MKHVVTSNVTAFLGLLLLLLLYGVISIRREEKIRFGSGDNKLLESRIRGHANFIETVPIALMLLFFTEQILSRMYVLMLATLLFFGRCLHAYAFAYVHEIETHVGFRVTGTACTIAQIIACVLAIIGNSVTSG